MKFYSSPLMTFFEDEIPPFLLGLSKFPLGGWFWRVEPGGVQWGRGGGGWRDGWNSGKELHG
jgi:hypothetical protein